MTNEVKLSGSRVILFGILIPMLTVFIMAILFEVGLRIAGFNPLSHILKGRQGNSYFLRKAEDPLLRVELNPGFQGVFEGARLVINGQGMRGRELSRDKDGHIRVALLGDSIALARTVSEDRIFATRLERMLQAVNPRYEVFNLGTDGYDTVQEVFALRDKGLAFDPDVVVVCYCLNDIGITPLDMGFVNTFIQPRIPPLWRLRIWQWINLRLRRMKTVSLFKRQIESVGAFDEFYGNLFPAAEKDAFLEEQFLAIAESQQLFNEADHYDRKRIVLESPGNLWLNQYTDLKNIGKIRYAFKELADLARTHGFRVLVAVIPFFYKLKGRYLDLPAHRIVIHEAQAFGLGTVDLFPKFNAAGFKGLDLDGVHLSVRGHQIMAEALFEELGRQFFSDVAKTGHE
jgi:lysophospholipase L1-like esterase